MAIDKPTQSEAAMTPFHRSVLLAAMCAGVLLATPAAQAFTFQDGAGERNADANALAPGVKPYLDPTDKDGDGAKFDGKSTSKIEGDGFTLQFNGPSKPFGQRYDPDPLYNPLRR